MKKTACNQDGGEKHVHVAWDWNAALIIGHTERGMAGIARDGRMLLPCE
jgi:hypothetical protein